MERIFEGLFNTVLDQQRRQEKESHLITFVLCSKKAVISGQK
jgi:hypothetical protein